MAGLVSGIFGNVGGSSAKTDRSNQLTAFSDLKNVFNWALPFGQQQARTGQATTAAGVQDLGKAGGYFGKLASGDRPTALEAVAPQTNAALAQSDAEKRQLAASGTGRGGGVAGVNQQRDTDLMAKIDNMLFGARTAGAGGLAKVGEAESGVGLGETGQGIQAGSLASSSAGELGREALYSRGQSEQIHQKHVDQLAQSFEDLLSGLVPGGSGFEDALSKFGF
jgi:hypothetical protein